MKEGCILEEEELCNQCNVGFMRLHIEGCSCHISPPCSACTSAPLICDKCGHTQEAPELHTPVPTESDKAFMAIYQNKSKSWKEQLDDLPAGVFGFIRHPSDDGWGMTVRGKYPNGMTGEEILKKCGIDKYGCPHFYELLNGKFMFTYTYD